MRDFSPRRRSSADRGAERGDRADRMPGSDRGGRFREWDIKCKVYVGNLGNTASKHEIEGAFGKYGPLRNVWVARNPPGFAFVEYNDYRDAEDAVRALDGTRVCGTRIRVEMSSGRTRRSDEGSREGRSREGGSRGGSRREERGGGRRDRGRDRSRSRSRSGSRRRSPARRSRSRSRSARSDRSESR